MYIYTADVFLWVGEIGMCCRGDWVLADGIDFCKLFRGKVCMGIEVVS